MIQSYLFSVVSLLVAGASLTVTAANVSRTSDITSALSLSASKWIWNSAAATAGAQYTNFQLYVNGDYVGTGDRPRFGHRFCVDLLPSLNVFAVNGSTTLSGPLDGGLAAIILLTYSGTIADTLVTDSSWRTKGPPPPGWETLAFDDTTWPVATVVGSYGIAPWDTVVVNIPADPPMITLLSQWVWTDVISTTAFLPASSRVFRRTFTPAPGQVPATATILISADNTYTLYVNGVTIGSGANYKVAQKYTVTFATAPSEVVLAVLATNIPTGAAGLLVAMEVNMVPSGRTSCTAGSFLITDALWKSTKDNIPDGFEQPGFDDSAWPAVVSETTYPGAPWNTLTIETVATPVTV
ncbi:hypothetical protein B0H16DRAFT_1688367 [Mycena metata]|uniref:Uncharacterized protein n=1 Tax=Mycena metata TaxID=1033252 RepID=A0AAD7JC39_9AGAR|nr:hypothetical protein B0H16DRAFT_1688367 [Mycena metata]